MADQRTIQQKWERRFPDLNDPWTHWWVEGDGNFVAVVPGDCLRQAVEIVHTVHERYAFMVAYPARSLYDGTPQKQNHRIVIYHRRGKRS